MPLTVTTNLTTSQLITFGDHVYVASTGRILAVDEAIQSSTNTQFNITVAIDGTVVSTGSASAAILLNGTSVGGSVSTAGNHFVHIGATGVVRTVSSGIGVFTAGTGNNVINDGAVHAVTSGIVNNGGRYTLLNSGAVTARQAGVNVVGDENDLTNTGDIGSLAANAIDLFGNTSFVRNAGTLGGVIGIRVDGNSNIVVNSGQITGLGGITMRGEQNSLNNTDTGIVATLSTAVQMSGTGISRMTNSGSLTGGEFGVFVEAQSARITNHGLIEGTNFNAIAVDASTVGMILNNTGTIRTSVSTAIDGNVGVEVIINSGTIIGLLDLGGGADQVTNSGTIRGIIILGEGADVATTAEGRVIGSVIGDAGNDTLTGGTFADTLVGGDDNDVLSGGAGNDDLQGNAGADRIAGGAGDDRITAGTGTDTLTGGPGADDFVFSSQATIGIGAARDQITDFVAGADDLVMTFMDAFIGSAAFTAAGQVRYVQATGILTGNTDGDAAAEWAVLLVNRPAITAADFVF